MKDIKWPNQIFVRHKDPDNNGGWFMAEPELSADLDGEVLTKYVREGSEFVVVAHTTFELQKPKMNTSRKAKKAR